MMNEIDDEDIFGMHISNDILSATPRHSKNLTTSSTNPIINPPTNSSLFIDNSLSSSSPPICSQQVQPSQISQQQQNNNNLQTRQLSKPLIPPPQSGPSVPSMTAFLNGTSGQHKLSKKEKQRKDEYYKKLKDENEQLFAQIEKLKRLISTREAENVVLQQQVEFFMNCAGDGQSAHDNE